MQLKVVHREHRNPPPFNVTAMSPANGKCAGEAISGVWLGFYGDSMGVKLRTCC